MLDRDLRVARIRQEFVQHRQHADQLQDNVQVLFMCICCAIWSWTSRQDVIEIRYLIALSMLMLAIGVLALKHRKRRDLKILKQHEEHLESLLSNICTSKTLEIVKPLETTVRTAVSLPDDEPTKPKRRRLRDRLFRRRDLGSRKRQLSMNTSKDSVVGSNRSLCGVEKNEEVANECIAIRLYNEITVSPSDVCQPTTAHGSKIDELRERVKDVATTKMVNKLGGEVRCYEKYLDARNGDVDLAEKMFRNTAKFRLERGLDTEDSTLTKSRLEACEKSRHLWPGRFMDFTSNDGSPIQFFRFKDVHPKQLRKEITEEELGDFFVTWMEETLDRQNKANSKEWQSYLSSQNFDLDSPVHPSERESYSWKSFIEIHDVGGIGRQQLYPAGIMMLIRVLKIGQGHYPENLRMGVVCNAPWYFRSAWSMISKKLDPKTRDRIVVDSGIPFEKLREFLSEEQIDEIFQSQESSVSKLRRSGSI